MLVELERVRDMHEASLQVLGPALDEMVADGVPWTMVQHAGRTMLIWWGISPGFAAAYWDTGQFGSAIPPALLQKIRSLATPKDAS